MQAFQEIGFFKAIRFIWFALFSKILHWCLLPPLRVTLLRLAGAKIGKGTIIMDVEFTNLYHYGFKKLLVGDHCFFGDGVMLDVRGGIEINNAVTVSNRVSIVTHINVGYKDHPLQKVYPTSEKKVVIQDGVYVGTGAIILPGVTIGKQAIVGAGAVVTRDILAKSLVVGVPARPIRKI